MVCRRGDGDELLDTIAVKWSVNLLRIPRAGVEVGDLFMVKRRALEQWDCLRDLYRPKLELPTPRPLPATALDRVESRSYSAKVGFEALEGFLQGLGVPAVPLRAAIKASRAASVSLSFKVGEVRRTGLLPGLINREMIRRAKGAHWESVDMTSPHYVAHAVWDAQSIEIKMEGEAETVSELSASLTKVAKGTAGITAKRNSSGLIKYERDEPIVFGLQVTAVRLDDGIPVLDEAADPGPQQVRGGGQATPEAEDATSGTLIGARNGSPFVLLRTKDGD